jgi:hypothetical protein
MSNKKGFLVETKYYGPTTRRGARIKITADGRSKFVSYPYSAGDLKNTHSSAAITGIFELKLLEHITDIKWLSSTKDERGEFFSVRGE